MIVDCTCVRDRYCKSMSVELFVVCPACNRKSCYTRDCQCGCRLGEARPVSDASNRLVPLSVRELQISTGLI